MTSDNELVDGILKYVKGTGVSKSRGYMLLGKSMYQLINPVEPYQEEDSQDFEDNIADVKDEELAEYEQD